MTHRLTVKDILALGFMTFALFVGAGNIIFPPMVGIQSGEHVYTTSPALNEDESMGDPIAFLGQRTAPTNSSTDFQDVQYIANIRIGSSCRIVSCYG